MHKPQVTSVTNSRVDSGGILDTDVPLLVRVERKESNIELRS